VDRNSPYRRGAGVSPATGLSLVEVLVVLVIVAIALGIGVPGLGGLLAETRLQTESRRLLGALNLARSEAILRNQPVSVCPVDAREPGVANCTGTYSDGWMVFANVDRDRAVDPADRVLRLFEGLPPGYRVTNRSGTSAVNALINYAPDGSAHRPLTLQFCPPVGGAAAPLSIVLNIVGRARLQRDWGTCPASV